MLLAHEVVTHPFQWRAHPDVWTLMLVLEMGYLYIVNRVGPRHVSPGDEPVSRPQIALFTLGVLSMWFVADWPIHEISENFLFSAHMSQHLVFSLVSAPLLLLGTPGWMVRLIVSPKPVMAVMKNLTRPVPAMLIFNGFLVFSHWPVAVEAALGSGPLHFTFHLVLVATSLLMWWPVLSPISELPRISHPAQMFYLFLQTIVPTVPASFLTFSDKVFYATYEHAPRIFGISPLTDQRLAGVVMKLVGGAFLWTVIAVLFFRWSAREDSGSPDPLEWQNIERELNEARRA